MKTIKGDYATRPQAEQAVEALVAAGVQADKIRLWNILPEKRSTPQGGRSTLTGAVTGAVLGGPGGFVFGAAVGNAYERDPKSQDSPRPPEGVQLVVDLVLPEEDLKKILRECGARNVA